MSRFRKVSSGHVACQRALASSHKPLTEGVADSESTGGIRVRPSLIAGSKQYEVLNQVERLNQIRPIVELAGDVNPGGSGLRQSQAELNAGLQDALSCPEGVGTV